MCFLFFPSCFAAPGCMEEAGGAKAELGEAAVSWDGELQAGWAWWEQAGQVCWGMLGTTKRRNNWTSGEGTERAEEQIHSLMPSSFCQLLLWLKRHSWKG